MPIQPDDICFNKGAIVERSIRRVHAEFALNPELDNYSHIDAMTLNLERACQACIDMAMHIVSRDHLGIPQSSADAFRFLNESEVIPKEICSQMVAMIGFRNIAVHEYQELDMAVVRSIATHDWKNMVEFVRKCGVTIKP